MKTDKAYGAFSQLPTWAKGVIAVVAVGGVALIGWKIYKGMQEYKNQQQNREDLKDVKSTLNKLGMKGVKPTLSDGQLASMSATLRSAFDQCGTGNTDVDNVFKQMKNEADVYALIEKYGTRKYDGCNWEMDFGDHENTLPDALSSEGNSSSVNKILTTNKVNFQF